VAIKTGKPALRRQAVTASWWRRFAGPGDVLGHAKGCELHAGTGIAHHFAARFDHLDSIRQRQGTGTYISGVFTQAMTCEQDWTDFALRLPNPPASHPRQQHRRLGQLGTRQISLWTALY
jgi:hypothetical protein